MIEEQGDEVTDSTAAVPDTDHSVAYSRGSVAHLRKNLSISATDETDNSSLPTSVSE